MSSQTYRVQIPRNSRSERSRILAPAQNSSHDNDRQFHRYFTRSSPEFVLDRLLLIMANPPQLYLLADHIKLSLLERQRAISLNLEPNSQDGHISRSLDSMREGLEALEQQQAQAEERRDSYAPFRFTLNARIDLNLAQHQLASKIKQTISGPNSTT
jgi:hypothetical protein